MHRRCHSNSHGEGGAYADGEVGLDINTQLQVEGSCRGFAALAVGGKEGAEVMGFGVHDAPEPATRDEVLSTLGDGGGKSSGGSQAEGLVDAEWRGRDGHVTGGVLSGIGVGAGAQVGVGSGLS